MKISLCFIGLLLLTGCSTTNVAECIAAAAKDKAKVSLKITTVWATIDYAREMPSEVKP